MVLKSFDNNATQWLDSTELSLPEEAYTEACSLISFLIRLRLEADGSRGDSGSLLYPLCTLCAPVDPGSTPMETGFTIMVCFRYEVRAGVDQG